MVCDLSHPHGGFPGAPGGILAQDRRLWHTHLPQDARHHDSLTGRMFALAAGREEEISQSPNVQRACMPCPGLQRRARPPTWQYLRPQTTATRGLAIVPSGTEVDGRSMYTLRSSPSCPRMPPRNGPFNAGPRALPAPDPLAS